MIENWYKMSAEEKMITLLHEARNNYYDIRQIDDISDSIKIIKIIDDSKNDDFFHIYIHSQVPRQYLENDSPIIGFEMMGTNIALGENKFLVDSISEKVNVKNIERFNFKELITEVIGLIGEIKVIFLPHKYFTKIHQEIDFDYNTDSRGIASCLGNKFKVIHSTKSYNWKNIVFLGQDSIIWHRKCSHILPKNVIKYNIISEKNECLRLTYRMGRPETKFYIGTFSKCEINNPKKIAVFEPSIYDIFDSDPGSNII